jgi:ABC-type amino acid transport substrate-binding protein
MIFRKLSLLVSWVALLAASAVTFAQERVITLPDGQVASEGIARIIERGELRVGMHAFDQVPFFYRENQTTKGTDAELAEDIASVGEISGLVRWCCEPNGLWRGRSVNK